MTLALAFCALLGLGEALHKHGSEALEARADQDKPFEEWVQNQVKSLFQGPKAPDDKGAQQIADMGKKALEWMQSQAKLLPQAGKAAVETSAAPASANDFGKKAQEWMQDQMKNLLHGAQAQPQQEKPKPRRFDFGNTESATPAFDNKPTGEAAKEAARQPAQSPPEAARQPAQQSPPEAVRQPAQITPPAAQGDLEAARQPAQTPPPEAARQPAGHYPPQAPVPPQAPPAARPAPAAARMPPKGPFAGALAPDRVKYLNKANAAGFTSNVLATKALPGGQHSIYAFGSHSGSFKPKAGVVSATGALVSKDGSARTNSLGMIYSPSSKPVYVRGGVYVPARTPRGKQAMKALSSKLYGKPPPAESDSFADFDKELQVESE